MIRKKIKKITSFKIDKTKAMIEKMDLWYFA